MKLTGLLLVFASAMPLVTAQTTVFDARSLGENYVSDNLDADTWFAQRFTTGTEAATLGEVRVLLSNAVDFSLELEIWSQHPSGDLPYAQVGPDFGTVGPLDGAGEYSIGGNHALAAETTYWVLFKGAGGEGSLSAAEVSSGGTGGWLDAADYRIGLYDLGGWLTTSGYVANISLSTAPTAVPEPSTYALLAGLGGLGAVAMRRRGRAWLGLLPSILSLGTGCHAVGSWLRRLPGLRLIAVCAAVFPFSLFAQPSGSLSIEAQGRDAAGGLGYQVPVQVTEAFSEPYGYETIQRNVAYTSPHPDYGSGFANAAVTIEPGRVAFASQASATGATALGAFTITGILSDGVQVTSPTASGYVTVVMSYYYYGIYAFHASGTHSVTTTSALGMSFGGTSVVHGLSGSAGMTNEPQPGITGDLVDGEWTRVEVVAENVFLGHNTTASLTWLSGVTAYDWDDGIPAGSAMAEFNFISGESGAYFGGITSITQYGVPITDAVVNSTLGLNYFQSYAPPSAVPEPSTYALLAGLGVLGVVVIRRRVS